MGSSSPPPRAVCGGVPCGLAPAGKAVAELPDFGGPLYTAEVNPRLRVYACAGCGRELVLGKDGVPATIDEAKVAGCGVCGGHLFRRQSGRPS